MRIPNISNAEINKKNVNIWKSPNIECWNRIEKCKYMGILHILNAEINKENVNIWKSSNIECWINKENVNTWEFSKLNVELNKENVNIWKSPNLECWNRRRKWERIRIPKNRWLEKRKRYVSIYEVPYVWSGSLTNRIAERAIIMFTYVNYHI